MNPNLPDPINAPKISDLPSRVEAEQPQKHEGPSVGDIQSNAEIPDRINTNNETIETKGVDDSTIKKIKKELNPRITVLEDYTNYLNAKSQFKTGRSSSTDKAINSGIRATSTTKKYYGYFRRGFSFVLDSKINLLRNHPDVKHGVLNITSTASPFIGLALNALNLVITPYLFYKSWQTASKVDAHIKGIDEKSFIAQSNNQFIKNLTHQLEGTNVDFKLIKENIALNENGLDLNLAMHRYDRKIDRSDPQALLKLLKTKPEFVAGLLSRRDYQHANVRLKILRKMLANPDIKEKQVHNYLLNNGISIKKSVTKTQLNEKLTDSNFRDALFLAIHSKQKSMQGLKALQSSRYEIHLKRNAEQKEEIRDPLNSALDDITTKIKTSDKLDETFYTEASRQLKELGLNLAELPLPGSSSFKEVIALQSEINAIDIQLQTPSPPADREELISKRLDLENKREYLSRELPSESIMDSLKALAATTNLPKEELLGIASHNKARRIETMSASSKNGLAAMSKDKAIRERKYFAFSWFKQKLMSPIGLLLSAVTIVSTILVLTGTIAATPVVLTAIATAFFWVGVGFAIAGIVHQIRNKPQQLWQNAAHLRGTRKLLRQIPLEITQLQHKKRTLELRYSNLLQNTISARLDQNLSIEEINRIGDALPSKLKKILEMPVLSEKDRSYLEKTQAKYLSNAKKTEKKLLSINNKLKSRQSKVQKHLNEISKAARKDALHGGISLRGLIGLKPKDNYWKELGIIFPQEARSMDLNNEIRESKDQSVTLIKALIEIDQAGGLPDTVKEEMINKMGIDFDKLKQRVEKEGLSLKEELPKTISHFFSSGIGNIYHVTKQRNQK